MLKSLSHPIEDLLRRAEEKYRRTLDGSSIANGGEKVHPRDPLLRWAPTLSHQPNQGHAVRGDKVGRFQDFSEFGTLPCFHQHVDICNAYESTRARTPCALDDTFDMLVKRKGGHLDSNDGKSRDYVGLCMEGSSITIPVRRGMFHKRHDPLVGDDSEKPPYPLLGTTIVFLNRFLLLTLARSAKARSRPLVARGVCRPNPPCTYARYHQPSR